MTVLRPPPYGTIQPHKLCYPGKHSFDFLPYAPVHYCARCGLCRDSQSGLVIDWKPEMERMDILVLKLRRAIRQAVRWNRDRSPKDS